MSMQPLVGAKDRSNQAALSRTLIHEYARARLPFDVEDSVECAKWEVDAGAVAYLVGWYWGLDTSQSAFYLATWEIDGSEGKKNRLHRISSVVNEMFVESED